MAAIAPAIGDPQGILLAWKQQRAIRHR